MRESTSLTPQKEHHLQPSGINLDIKGYKSEARTSERPFFIGWGTGLRFQRSVNDAFENIESK